MTLFPLQSFVFGGRHTHKTHPRRERTFGLEPATAHLKRVGQTRRDSSSQIVLTPATTATPAPREVVPWVEKYRPQTLQDVAAHKDIVDTGR